MDAERLRRLLTEVQEGQVGVDQALDRLRALPYDDIGYARLDVHGLPEVVFCQNKTAEQATGILERLWEYHDRVLATRVTAEMAAAIQSRLPQAEYDPTSRLLNLARTQPSPPDGDAPYAMVVSGGTSDLPVAEEAAQTAEFMGSPSAG
jgi:NCAIR mutase (PurE)-related protein